MLLAEGTASAKPYVGMLLECLRISKVTGAWSRVRERQSCGKGDRRGEGA